MARFIGIFLLVFPFTARAGLLFEPYVGYAVGNYSLTHSKEFHDKDKRGETEKGSIEGITYGGRLAWLFETFFLGGDYQVMRGTYKPKGEGESSDWESTSIFGILGWQFSMGFRLYGGITVREHKSIRGTEDGENIYSGSARKIGIGYRYEAPVAINAEYIEYNYGKASVDGEREPLSKNYDRFKHSAVVVAVSFPFELGGR